MLCNTKKQLKSKHQAQKIENQKEVCKTNQESESLLTVSSESPHKDTLIKQKKNVVIFGNSITKRITTWLSNKNVMKSKVVCRLFPGATSKEFVHFTEPTLQENVFGTPILHMGENDVLKLGSNIDTVSKDIINIENYCKNVAETQIIISGLTLTTQLSTSFIYQLNNSIKVLHQKHSCSLMIIATYHLRIHGKTDCI